MFGCCADSPLNQAEVVNVTPKMLPAEALVPVPEPKPAPVREPVPEPVPEPVAAPAPVVEPVQQKPPSVSIEFDTGRGLRTVEITQKPLGMVFKNTQPLSVACVEIGGAADKAGVNPDWIFKKVAGQPVSSYQELLNSLKAAVKPLAEPTPDPPGSVAIIFVTDNPGYTKRVCFTKKPLGLSYDKRLPMVVKTVEAGSNAAQLGVQPGWTFSNIGGKSLNGLKEQEAFDLLANCFNSKFNTLWPDYEAKMKAGGKESSSKAAIDAFKYNFSVLASGASTMMPETDLDPVKPLPELASLNVNIKPELLKKTVILKLNGGLGTGMGLDKAKSLLPVKGSDTFLDLIAKQVGWMKSNYNQQDLAFMLMNSFSTSDDTRAALSKYSDLPKGSDLEFVQNKAPKVTKDDLSPASWPKDSSHEWCPPGHGDLYPAMLGSGTLDKLLAKGIKYMFVSNSDNLGATMDLKLLTYFADSGAPFMMEVAARTDADKKGGHLATMKNGGLTLRESAQCPPEDEAAFQDVTKYTYFNTNNLWVDLTKLKTLFDQNGGAIPLPVMVNEKTVDPRDKKSTKVIQLETAMGAAISSFQGATAILIPRTRFAPVKKCDDLLALRSDAYVLTPDFRMELAPERNGVPPTVKLDDMYKFVDAMDTLIPNGVPSLLNCKSLKIEGAVEFAAGVVIKGDVKIKNSSGQKKTVAEGTYENTTLEL